MTKGRIGLLIIASLSFLTVGFVVGQMVQAAGTIPGSAGDPLVAQSYVEKAVGETLDGLQTKIEELQAKVDSLEQQIESVTPSSSTVEKPAVEEPSSVSKTVVVSGKSANIRSGPGTNYKIIGRMLNGEKGVYIREQNGWYKITMPNGQEGWITNTLSQVE